MLRRLATEAWARLALLLCALLTSLPALAQAPTGTEAEMRREADILFQKILVKPNDLDSTFRYSSLQAALGDQEAAIGGLERMLFYNPNLPRVQLELGVLYFKLGSYEMARTHFDAAIASPDVPEDVREKVANFLREIDRRVADNQFLLFGSAGLRYQSNASVGPDSQVVRALGSDAVLSSQYLRKPDGNAFASAQFRHVYDFGTQRGDTWESNVALYDTHQFRITRLDLGVAQVDTGPRFAIGDGLGLSIRPYAIGAFVGLGNRPYLLSPGGGLSARWLSPGGLLVEPGIEIASRRFVNSQNYPNATNQNGGLLTAYVNLGTPLPVFSDWRLLVRPYYARAAARYEPYSYDQGGVDVSVSTEFEPLVRLWSDRRWSFTTFAGYSHTHYRVPDTIVDPTTERRDNIWRVGGIMEISVYQWLGVAGQVSYAQTLSTVPNFRNRNFIVSFAPTVRF